MKHINALAVPTTLEDVCDPRRLALVIYDMQVGITSQVKDGDAILAKVKQVLTAARSVGVRTFFTRHMSLPKELMGAFQYRMAMAWQRVVDPAAVKPWFLRDSPSFAIVPELTPLASEAIFDKLAMSAFEGTPLEFALRDCGISAVAIVGIAMEIGLIPVIIADACGAGHADAAKRSLESLAFAGDAMITDVARFCELMARSQAK
jgi:nicotinamidase-related amidase